MLHPERLSLATPSSETPKKEALMAAVDGLLFVCAEVLAAINGEISGMNDEGVVSYHSSRRKKLTPEEMKVSANSIRRALVAVTDDFGKVSDSVDDLSIAPIISMREGKRKRGKELGNYGDEITDMFTLTFSSGKGKVKAKVYSGNLSLGSDLKTDSEFYIDLEFTSKVRRWRFGISWKLGQCGFLEYVKNGQDKTEFPYMIDKNRPRNLVSTEFFPRMNAAFRQSIQALRAIAPATQVSPNEQLP